MEEKSEARDFVGSPGGGASEPVRTIPLLDAMVDVALVYGFDESCSRELGVMADEQDFDRSVDVLISEHSLKIHFLQVVTPGLSYPQRCCNVVSNEHDEGEVPGEPAPGSRKSTMSDGVGGPGGTSPMLVGGHKKKFNIEDFGLTWDSMQAMHFFLFPEGTCSSGAPPSSPSSAQELPPPILLTCTSDSYKYPKGPRIYTSSEDIPASIIHLLFTDILGERSYRSVLRFSRPFIITRYRESQYFSLKPWSSEVTPPQGCKYRLVYLPTSLILVSKRPCFQFMKDVLSGFHSYFVEEGDDRDFWDLVKTYTERIFLIPCPPPGSLSVEYQLLGFSSSMRVRPPRGALWGGAMAGSLTHQRPEQYLDIRLTYPFMCLSENNVMTVISALLTEQTILFISSLYPMLMYVIQCFLSYVYPFVWRHSIVPILPHALLEVLDAPVATIIGMHSSFTSEPEFKRIENAVIVDLDNDSVRVILDKPLPPLPRGAVEIFKLKYKLLMKQNYEVCSMQKLAPTCIDTELRRREEFDNFIDDALAKMFLELMVRLYSKVLKQLLRSRLHYEETVKAMESEEEQNFYRQAEATDMFSAFYQRLKQGAAMDDFNLLAVRLEREERRQQGQDMEDSFYQVSTRARGSVLSINTGVTSWYTMTRKYVRSDRHKERKKHSIESMESSLPEDAEPAHLRVSPLSALVPSSEGLTSLTNSLTLVLPSLGSDFDGREKFLENVVASLDDLHNTDKTVQAQCIYLRGFYRLCQRDVVGALEDIYNNLQRLEVALVPDPKNFLVLPKFLSASEKAQLHDQPHYKHVCTPQKKAVTKRTGIVDPNRSTPRQSLNHGDFLRLVRQYSIATDAETASNLHKVLAMDRTTVVSPEVFKTFYEAWKGVLAENQGVELPNITVGKVDQSCCIAEQVLAVAANVRTNYSSNTTLLITTYRLLAVAGFDSHVMAEFSTPLRFEYFSYAPSIIAAKLPGIRVEFTAKTKSRVDKKKPQDVFMAFEDHVERENWYHLLVEMVSGYSLSQRLKDPGVIEMAQGHVLLQNTINQSGILENCQHVRRTKRAMKLLSFQAKDASEISPITVEALQYRINPSRHETEKQTVESLLYIPPNMEEEGGCGQGKLWIGLGNGRLKVYDIESKCFESDIKITESKHGRSVRLSCLLLVNQHVWVGSHSKNIHILDAESVCHVSQLSYLEDAPRDMELSEDRRVVWTLLLNGILLSWDPVTRKRISKIQVPFSEQTQYITCTCFAILSNYIWVGTNRGSISIMDTELGSRSKEIFFPGGSKRQIEIKHLAVSSEGEVWCSVYSVPRGEDSTFVAVFNPSSYEKVMHYNKLDNRVSVILPVNNSMWCGTKSGKIYVFHSRTYANGENMPKILSAHEDFIRTMTLTDINLVVSGSGSNDGYAAVWKTINLPD